MSILGGKNYNLRFHLDRRYQVPSGIIQYNHHHPSGAKSILPPEPFSTRWCNLPALNIMD
jgi:hypothetical protein